MTRSVLVTGSDGFIGRHFVRHLREHGGWHVTPCDIKSGVDCRDIFSTNTTYDLVIHCAADLVGDREVRHYAPYRIAHNIALDAAMLEHAVRTKVRHVVYFSSCAVYGHFSQPIREDDATSDLGDPDDWYGMSKLIGEQLAYEAEMAGVLTHIVRPFSGYGTDQSTDYPFGSFLWRAQRLHERHNFEVWGDGSAIRDWVHVDDIVGAVMAMVAQDVGGPVNIGTGRPTTFAELATMFVTATGYTRGAPLEFLTGKPAGIPYRVADTTLLTRFYTPQVSLEEGIARALDGR